MTLLHVAQFAGVSPSTVSRVINDYPSVNPQTAELVRQSMRDLDFTPTRRRGGKRLGRPPLARATEIALVVFSADGSPPTPAFEPLVRGVSAAAAQCKAQLQIWFFPPDRLLPPEIFDRSIGGLLLHGEQPSDGVVRQISRLPAVWLMPNRHRPAWGDQVVSDGACVGEQAAQYLIGRNHNDIAFLTAEAGNPNSDERALAFAATAREAGVNTHLLHATPAGQVPPAGSLDAMRELVQNLLRITPRPTGLFVAEDRLLLLLDAALAGANVETGPGKALEVVSCNPEGAYFGGMCPLPATIDVRADAIGRRGVDQLLWRIKFKGPDERIRLMVEPKLVERPMSNPGVWS